MMRSFINRATRIYLACGATDFRKQITGLTSLVSMKFELDPFQDDCVFLFCNKKKTSIKVLRYDKNGFILATKTLLDGMKFQWPSRQEDIRQIDRKQVEWLLDGLAIEQVKAHHEVKITKNNTCF
jgi:transposase